MPKTWVDQCVVKPGTFTRWEFYGFLFFHLTVIVKDIYRSKYGNMCGQIIMHSTTNYFIYLTMENNKVLQTCRLQTGRSRLVGPDSSVYRASALRLNHMHRSLSFDFSFSPWVPLLSNVCVVCVKRFTICFFYL